MYMHETYQKQHAAKPKSGEPNAINATFGAYTHNIPCCRMLHLGFHHTLSLLEPSCKQKSIHSGNKRTVDVQLTRVQSQKIQLPISPYPNFHATLKWISLLKQNWHK